MHFVCIKDASGQAAESSLHCVKTLKSVSKIGFYKQKGHRSDSLMTFCCWIGQILKPCLLQMNHSLK